MVPIPLQPSSVGFSWANAPRVFLASGVPGYFSSRGTICLPLALDAATHDTGIQINDDPVLDDWFVAHTRYFACRSPALKLFPSEKDYREFVQPSWLRTVVDNVDQTIRRYSLMQPRPGALMKRTVDSLTTVWGEIQPLISASLYMGEGDMPADEFILFHQDLSFYGHPFPYDPDDLRKTLNFLDTFSFASELMKAGLTENLRIECEIEGNREVRDLYDAVRASGGEGEEDLRPVSIYEADSNGEIDPFRYEERNVGRLYIQLQSTMISQSQIFSGFFLFARYEVGEDDLGALLKLLKQDDATVLPRTPAERVEGYLRERGISLGQGSHGLEARAMAEALVSLRDAS